MSKGTALITGASSGIGEALARKFAASDFDLIITARREPELRSLAEELSGDIDVHVIPCDLTAGGGPAQLTDAVSALGIEVDVLVNNAGVSSSHPFHTMSDEEVHGLLALNVDALAWLTHYFLPIMVERGSGRILNVASVAAFQPVPAMSLYAATKAFVLSLSESLSEELRGTGVSVTALCPGITQTDATVSFNGLDVPSFIVSSAAEVADEGYDAVMAREVIRVPGIANQAAITWAKFQPRWLVRGVGGLFTRLKGTAGR